MTDEELDDCGKITSQARERIAAKTQQTPDEVAQLVHLFRQTKIMALWLQNRYAQE
jgi:hypothetical protein